MDLNYGFMANTLWMLLRAIPVSLKITLVALVLSAPVAFGLALVMLKKVKYLKGMASFYVSMVRGVPMVIQILLFYSLLPSFLNYVFKRLGIGYNIFDLDTVWYAYAVFTFSAAAVLAEVFRSALKSVSEGQMEAGLAAGMEPLWVYLRIIIPQALVVALPSVCNAAVNLLKNTSLAFLMAVKDITATGKIAASYGYNYVEAYIDVFFVYIIVCSLVQVLFKYGERSLGRYRALRS